MKACAFDIITMFLIECDFFKIKCSFKSIFFGFLFGKGLLCCIGVSFYSCSENSNCNTFNITSCLLVHVLLRKISN